MPLTPAYTWSETDSSIRLTVNNVPIKDQSQIFCSDRVVKLNAPPYLLLLDLKDTIDDDRSTATVTRGRDIQIQLAKSRPGQWGRLTAEGEKTAIKQQREESIKRAHEKQVAAQQERLARKQKEEKAAIDHQIAVEKAQRSRLDNLKQQELHQERQQLQDWQQQLPSKQHQAGSGDESDYEDDLLQESTGDAAKASEAAAEQQDVVSDHADYYGRGWQPSKSKAAALADPAVVEVAVSCGGSKHEGQHDVDNMPTLTAGSNSNMQQSVLQSLAADAAAATSTEKHAALANSNSLDSSSNEPLMSIVSTNSTVKHQDAQQGLQAALEAPAPPPTRPQAPVRCRATPVPVTFTQLQTQHLPAREQREVEIKSIKRQAKGDSVDVSDRQPAFLKDKGDGLAAQGNYRGAINAYTRAIELDPSQPSLWSNRAACHLALGAATDCETDCTTALQLLSATHARLSEAAGAPEADQELLAGLLPPSATAVAVSGCDEMVALAADTVLEGASPNANANASSTQQQLAEYEQHRAVTPAAGAAGSNPALAKLQQQLVKVLSRRAAARVELQQLKGADSDLQQALRLDPDNAQLKADALEVAAALNPTAIADPISLKQRGDARFKAGDMQGAIEAYTALVQLLEQEQQHQRQQEQVMGDGNSAQQQEQQQQLMLAALSNRAACWLSLEKYDACVADCLAALRLALADTVSTSSSHSSTSSSTVDSTGDRANDTASDTASERCRVPYAAVDNLSLVVQLLQKQQEQPQQLLEPAGAARVKSVARLLGRAAVAYGCLKQLQPAEQLYMWAEQYWQVAGDEERAAALAADRQKLKQL